MISLIFLEFPEASTPIPDISDLLIPWVRTMGDLNRVEAENIFEAQRRYLRASSSNSFQWFNYKEFQAIHRTMFNRVWMWAGKQRIHDTSIGVKPALIGANLTSLCAEVQSWESTAVELTFIEKSARIHHRLVYIHPFENGNGRFSRLVADRCLIQWKCSHPIWPSSLCQNGEVRKRYIHSLREADKGNYDLLIHLMKEFGAFDPGLEVLFQATNYRSYLEGVKGVAKVRALLKQGGNPNATNANGHRVLQLLLKDAPKSLAFLLVR